MAQAATASNVSLERFLSDPELETYEYRDGEVRDSVVGTPKHALIQMNVGALLRARLRKTRSGWVLSEARYRLPLPGRARFYLPGLCVVMDDPNALEKPYLDQAPELVVEIQSPDDSIQQLPAKIADYLEAGTPLAWVILPVERAVLVCRAGAEPVRLEASQTIDADPVLPGFEVGVAEFFE
ncbi:MAG: hypothetical protein GC160_00655 [Acidobacteria bacterium]|nr:hypothetical protein [Acidobacteriota bacterium]